VIRAEDRIVTSRAAAAAAFALEIEFADGRLPVGDAAKPRRGAGTVDKPDSDDPQGSLL
jgi:exodeoxyribonuclease VII large subunit